MGLTWSNVTVKNGCLIVCFTNFPTNDNLKNDLWNLWKNKKDELKDDGFSISKDPKTGAWKINYFHTVTDITYEKTVNNKHMWRHHFDTKVDKWTTYITESRQINTNPVNPVKPVKLVKEEIPDIINDDEDGDDDIDPELINKLMNKLVTNK